jgi:Kdo2-lipid IVA lauroyltransferase/acyltransferase
MYYILYGLLYTLSLLPWKVLYFFSDCAYFLIYYVFGYRRKVVMSNLEIAFPEKTIKERTRIAKDFYHNFLDAFIETLKFLSISDKAFAKRMTGNFELLAELYATGKNCQIHSGHFFNWEYMNWSVPRNSPYPFIGVYLHVDNPAVNKIILKMRQRYGSIMISTREYQNKIQKYTKDRYAIGLYADQNTARLTSAFWLPFFRKLAPFVSGPEKSARINDAAVVFVNNYKVKRGYYHAEFELVTMTPRDYGRGELTKTYVAWLEKCVSKRPYNYLWSHRRWKYPYSDEYKKMLITRGE